MKICDQRFKLIKLPLSFQTRSEIALETIGQSSNPLWHQLRQKRLTGSQFGDAIAVIEKRH